MALHHQQQQKRKKWTEEEERTLIDKYAEMASDGTLARMRTREKKFRPIAAHVNSRHHAVDPTAFPFQWSWKDVSTKVQNMRHQYLLVKQKILACPAAATAPQSTGCNGDATDGAFLWDEGVSHWPNFLRYKEVFGDVPLAARPEAGAEAATVVPGGGGASEGGCFPIEEDGDLGLGLGFDCEGPPDGDEEGFDYDEPVAPLPMPPPLLPPPQPPPAAVTALRKKRKKRNEKRAWAFLEAQVGRLRELEARLEERDGERFREKERRMRALAEAQEGKIREAEEEWEERMRRRREEEREWEERMESRRAEWRKRMEVAMAQHRDEVEQIQARMLHDQHSIINQLLGIVTQWGGAGSLGDGSGLGGHQHHAYISQTMQNLTHMNGLVHGENRVGGDSQDDQFIVDG